MAEDVPKTTIVVLLVLTVIISIACTWVVLDKTMSTGVVYSSGPGQARGEVRVNIVGAGEDIAGPEAGLATGQIGIKIGEEA